MGSWGVSRAVVMRCEFGWGTGAWEGSERLVSQGLWESWAGGHRGCKGMRVTGVPIDLRESHGLIWGCGGHGA